MQAAAVCGLVLFGLSVGLAADSKASVRVPTNIQPQELGSALNALARIRDMQVLYLSETVRNRRTAGVSGDLTTDEALAQLLRGTGLTWRYVNDNAVTILSDQRGAGAARGPGQSAGDQRVEESAANPVRDRAGSEPTSTGSNSASAQAPSEVSERDSGARLEEIIVTASKRPQALRDIANSITAFTGDQLSRRGAQSFQDYLGRAPGVIFLASKPGVSTVTIRGVGTTSAYPDQGQATTGIYLNDVPLTDPGFTVSVPDLDVFDVQRVEVLRGPQGTLFGSATLGGAVNYILNPVSLTSYEAIAQLQGSRTASSSGTGYAAKAAVNLPVVEDVLGVRLTALKRFDPGYLDNLGYGGKDTNTNDVEGGRLTALWKINPNVDLSFLSFYDRARNGDEFLALPELGELVRDTMVPEEGAITTRINNLKLDAGLRFGTLTASFAESLKSREYVADDSVFYGSPTTTTGEATTKARMGELRLTSPEHRRIEWLVGAYYGWFDEDFPSSVMQDGETAYVFSVSYRSDEYALFGEGTYRFNDRWRATFGGRYYDIRIHTSTVQGPPASPLRDSGRQQESGFSPRVALTFEPSQELMAYALVSKGFRMGGVNLVTPVQEFPTPATYGSDELVNYEVGLRLTSPDRTLAFDASVFYIDWTDIQLRLVRPDGFSYAANAGAARSRGVESSLSWQPIEGLSLQASVTYLDAALAESLDLGNGTTLPDGATLPGASKWSTAETVSYRFPGLRYSPHVMLSHRYLSSAESDFLNPLPIGNYSVFDARAGVEVGNIGITAFVNNVGDRRGVTSALLFNSQVAEWYVAPRTIGLQFDWRL